MFLSYAHDSADHEDDVRFLARLLVAAGIDVVLDQWEHERLDWQAWATGAILSADRVIAVASPRYAAAAGGTGRADRVFAETTILRDLLHSAPRTWTAKILPVVLPTHSPADLPRFLMPALTSHFAISELSSPGIEDLVRVITHQRRRIKPAPGAVPPLPPEPEPERHRSQAPRDLVGYAAEVSPHCLAIRAELARAREQDVRKPLITKAGWVEHARTIRRFHDAAEAGWWRLSAVRLPTSEEDRRRVRQWQETYLGLVVSLRVIALNVGGIANRPSSLFLVGPLLLAAWGEVRSLKALNKFDHQCRLLGITNPFGGRAVL
ncbi:TIR domain-containing protein [Actinokineospora baliensis]|uniref:TIR domain-containing protein n=1 Tax=Actinokineospora baliensis TaxID=547056 RepID=UPI0027DBB04A|nr:TIR domain-containing protein [Actinokineospora baliensis]